MFKLHKHVPHQHPGLMGSQNIGLIEPTPRLNPLLSDTELSEAMGALGMGSSSSENISLKSLAKIGGGGGDIS